MTKMDLSRLILKDDENSFSFRLKRFFDEHFYLQQIGEADNKSIENPLDHYISVGWKAKLDPSPKFSTSFYLDTHHDVRAAGECPLVHYFKWGIDEGRAISRSVVTQGQIGRIVGSDQFDTEQIREVIAPHFDSDFYLANSPDLQGSDIDLLTHFLSHGWKEWRDPSRSFSTAFYLEQNEDVRNASVNPFYHYLKVGLPEGRRGTPFSFESEEHNRIKAERSIIADEFDDDFYLSSNPDLVGYDGVLVDHFLQHGWLEERDPTAFFSVRHYLATYSDIREAGANPFVHYVAYGRTEGRSGLPFSKIVALRPFNPAVTAIIPNYNHEKYLSKRIDSVLNQTYKSINIVILDDLSTDQSEAVILDYQRRFPSRIKFLPNKAKSTGVFAQWKKGLQEADGDLVWICESDDFCELDLVEKLIQPMRDPSVTLSFGRIQFAETDGSLRPGLDDYRSSLDANLWDESFNKPAGWLFKGPFALANIIPNVGGCLFRRAPISDAVWDEIIKYKIVGDWFFYAIIAAGGQVAYAKDAVAYFRQHAANTSVKSFLSKKYYSEHEDILKLLRARWAPDDEVCSKAYQRLFQSFQHAKAKSSVGPLSSVYSNDRVLQTGRANFHLLIAIYGFHLGGGEIFPINLANYCVELGLIVSILVLAGSGEDSNVRSMLDKRIPVYDARLLQENGVSSFIEEMSIDLIHSHNAGLEFFFFFNNAIGPDIPYVVTLHGSYEVTDFTDQQVEFLRQRVSHWTYLSPKNLSKLGEPSHLAVDLIPNGSPEMREPISISRESLKIGANDIVYALASRAIPEKGWLVAIEAVSAAQLKSAKRLHLLLCGTGPDASIVQRDYSKADWIHYLGFQSNVTGIFKIADVVLLPTRFAGESLPLVLIQGLQAGKMLIATAIGEIPELIHSHHGSAGLTVPFEENDETFKVGLISALIDSLDPDLRSYCASVAKLRANDFSMERAGDSYLEIYSKLVGISFHAMEQFGRTSS